MVGRLIPAGTGLAYHAERRRKRAQGVELAAAVEAELAAELSEAEVVESDSSEG